MFLRTTLSLSSAFAAGFALMALELLSARILAPLVGSTTVTWTSVIGVTLLGLAFGAYSGGKLIDRFPRPAMLALGFALSAFFIAIIPSLVMLMNGFDVSAVGVLRANLILSLAFFLLPSFFLGTLEPMILKLSAHDISEIGREYGMLSAAWSLGSILGVYVTGFYFVSYFGILTTLRGIVVILAIFSLLFVIRGKRIHQTPPTLFAAAGLSLCAVMVVSFFPFSRAEADGVLHQVESEYYLVRVAEGSFGGFGKGRLLYLDMDSHNFSPEGFSRQKIYTDIAPLFAYLVPEPQNAYFIGGGAYLMPKDFAQRHPEARTIVAELDPAVTNAAEEFFGLDQDLVTSIHEDGRAFLQNSSERYDVIMNDGFSSFISMPFHLLTFEMNEVVKQHLQPGGLYVGNVIGTLEGEASILPKSALKTLSLTFPNYAVVAFGKNDDDVQNVLFFAVNDDDHRDLALLLEEAVESELNTFGFSARVISKESIDLSDAMILTDNHAPVERLSAPLVEQFFPTHYKIYKEFFPEGYRL